MCTRYQESLKTIGIVGGMGTAAGLDLANKILLHTQARSDCDHIPVRLVSNPSKTPDRSTFLQGEIHQNPANEIVALIKKLDMLEAGVIGMPCNTAHAPRIYNPIERKLRQIGCKARLVNMLEASGEFLRHHYPHLKKVGLLATSGTYQAGVYDHYFARYGIDIINPSQRLQRQVHAGIYHPDYGIKSTSFTNPEKVRHILFLAMEKLETAHAQAVILGCSELGLLITQSHHHLLPIIDPTTILARKLIQLSQPEKLKPLQ